MKYPSDEPWHNAWRDMKSRCDNPNNKRYKHYGGRGITYCSKWKDFHNFLLDMGPTWYPGLSLDRIDNDGNYCKENCRWATRSQQEQNKRQFTNDTCPNGHPYTEDNIVYKGGTRRCKTCIENYKPTAIIHRVWRKLNEQGT